MKDQKLPLGVVVAKMNREMFRVLRKRFYESSETKLTIEQFGLLFAISNNEEDVVQQDMANFFGKDKSSILRLIDTLEEKELIQRIIDSQDRRKKCLFVTDKGSEVIKQYLDIEFGLLDELQMGLTKSDMDTFYKVVQTIQKNAKEL
ncbi:MAG: MarR family transcriptional regulator [Bacteroidetes bacterium]|nr:MarR family transcriptional regulator [Bacteroidota bacterium]